MAQRFAPGLHAPVSRPWVQLGARDRRTDTRGSLRNDYSLAMKCAHRIYSLKDCLSASRAMYIFGWAFLVSCTGEFGEGRGAGAKLRGQRAAVRPEPKVCCCAITEQLAAMSIEQTRGFLRRHGSVRLLRCGGHERGAQALAASERPPPPLGRASCRPSSRTTSCGTVPLTSSTRRPVACMLFFGTAHQQFLQSICCHPSCC